MSYGVLSLKSLYKKFKLIFIPKGAFLVAASYLKNPSEEVRVLLPLCLPGDAEEGGDVPLVLVQEAAGGLEEGVESLPPLLPSLLLGPP